VKTYPKALHLIFLATLLLLGLLVGGLSGFMPSNGRGPSPVTSTAITTSICPEPGDRPAELVTTGEPLPFDCGIGKAAGEHDLP
jgi:hypothetical protein